MPKLRSSSEAELSQRRLDALGAQIKILREEREWSQTDLGVALAPYQADGKPVPQTTVSRWEKGQVDFTANQVRSIERAFGLAKGTLLAYAGYVDSVAVDMEDPERFLYNVIRTSPAIHPELRNDAVAGIKGFVKMSKTISQRDASLQRLRQPN